MLKKSILAMALIGFSLISHAELCPVPMELKQNQFNGWQAVDINSGDSVSGQRLEKFKKDVMQLALVEWMADAPEGAAHCYYHDTSGTAYLSIFLAKHRLKPETQTGDWRHLGEDVMQCRPSMHLCEFTASGVHQGRVPFAGEAS